MAEVDLERLAAGYDHRVMTAEAAARAGAAAAAAGLEAGRWALDVGGGRGRHGAVFAATGASVAVVDPSPAMTAAAAKQEGVLAVRGDGARLPVADGRADLVYFNLSLHHGPWRRMLSEAVRVAGRRGVVWIWTFHPDHHRESTLARWFPSVPAIDGERFPPPEDLEAELAGLGLTEVGGDEQLEIVEKRASEWLAGVRAGFVSTLHLLDQDELAAGIAGFVAAHPDPDQPVRSPLRYRSVHGRVAG